MIYYILKPLYFIYASIKRHPGLYMETCFFYNLAEVMTCTWHWFMFPSPSSVLTFRQGGTAYSYDWVHRPSFSHYPVAVHRDDLYFTLGAALLTNDLHTRWGQSHQDYPDILDKLCSYWVSLLLHIALLSTKYCKESKLTYEASFFLYNLTDWVNLYTHGFG